MKIILITVIIFLIIIGCARIEYVIDSRPKKITLNTENKYPIYNVDIFIDTVWALERDSNGTKTFRAITDTCWFNEVKGEIYRLHFYKEK